MYLPTIERSGSEAEGNVRAVVRLRTQGVERSEEVDDDDDRVNPPGPPEPHPALQTKQRHVTHRPGRQGCDRGNNILRKKSTV